MRTFDNDLQPGVYRFTVTGDLAGLRIDQYLAAASEGLSRSRARRLVNLGGVHLQGRRIRRCSQQVAAGERLEVFVDSRCLESMSLGEEHVLYRDQDLIVLDKPAGMATQPTPARYQGTVYAELAAMLGAATGQKQRSSIGMVQRLDQDTSGVMVFSIHPRAHKKMTAAFKNHAVRKVYWAIVAGCPDRVCGRFSSQLARRRSTNLMVSVERGGKQAETRYRLLRAREGISLVEVELVTGRSHQIRAHFSEAGWPLLGDTAYGGPAEIKGHHVARQMLHARHLGFNHPVTGEPMNFTAALPDDFASLVRLIDGLNDATL